MRGKELQCELETRTETKLRLPTGDADVVGPCDPPRALFGVGAPERTASVALSSRRVCVPVFWHREAVLARERRPWTGSAGSRRLHRD